MKRKLLYLSGKYSDITPAQIDANIQLARKYAVKLWELGFAVLCPHLNTANFEQDCSIDWQAYIDGDLVMIERCDAIVMLPNWKDSKGAGIEREHALKLGIPIVYPQQPEEVVELLSKGVKFDTGKLRYDLIDFSAMEKLAFILTMGASKYADNNWQNVEPFEARYFAALMRHLSSWKQGEKIDAESQKSHLDHAFCNLMFLMWKESKDGRKNSDDSRDNESNRGS